MNLSDEVPICLLLIPVLLFCLVIPRIAEAIPTTTQDIHITNKVWELPQDKEKLMEHVGIPENERGHVDFIIFKESSWNYRAVNKSSNATGLGQSIPYWHEDTWPDDYRDNPVSQLEWADSYVKQRYGSWEEARHFWEVDSCYTKYGCNWY